MLGSFARRSAGHRKTFARWAALTLIALGTACAGGGDGGPGTTGPNPQNPPPPPPPPPPPQIVPVATVTLDRAAATIEIGQTTRLTATARDANGNVLAGRAITWASEAQAVATVAADGLVSSVSIGSANITATSEGKTASAAISVVPVPVASVSLDKSEATLEVGASATFAATAKAANGAALAGRAFAWKSADPAIATVANGVVTAVAPGSTTITATSEGKSANATVVVLQPPPPSCEATEPTGRLVRATNGDGFVYTTRAGWTIRLTREYMRVTPAQWARMTYEYWGDLHENLNGKHIKDLLGTRRTVLLPGDVIVTIDVKTEPPPAGSFPMQARWISIYEGDESHRVVPQTNTVLRSCALPLFEEDLEHDGETARLAFNEEGLRFENVYDEALSPAGAILPRVFATVPLAQTYFDAVNRVNDFFDDPRLGHTN